MPQETQVDPGKAVLDQYDVFEDTESTESAVQTEPVAEPVVKMTTPVAEAKPKHPKAILSAAKNVGMDESDIAEYETTADLKEAVSILAMTQKSDRRQDNIDTSVRRDPKTGQFVKPVETPAEPEKEFDLKDVGVDLEDFDDDTQVRLKKALTPLAKQLKAVNDELAAAKQRDMQREMNATADQLDQLFMKHPETFGTGERHDLDRSSAEFKKRMMVIGELSRMHRDGESVSLKNDFAKVAKLIVAVAPEPVAHVEEPKREIADPHGYRNGHTNMPTTRMPVPEKKGTKTAVSAVATLLKNRISEESDDDELGLPEN